MLNPDYFVALNFLALTSQEFGFIVYRKRCDWVRTQDKADWYRGSLPIESVSNESLQGERASYWISLEPRDEFEIFHCHCRTNNFLTKYVLHKALEARLALTDLQYEVSTKCFETAIRFKVKKYLEGYEVIRLEPYYLSVASQFGFRIDFEFQKNENVPFTRKIQRLSLSLDENYKSNRNFYVDRYAKIKAFITNYLVPRKIFPIKGNLQSEINIEHSLYELKAKTLSPKTYIFGNGREGQEQLAGLRRFGPLQRLETAVQFYFSFTDNSREYAIDLYKALCGNQYATTFAGMQDIFGVVIEKNNTTRTSLRSFKEESIEHLAFEVKDTSKGLPIQITILPSKELKKEYLDLYYYSSQARIPLQNVSLELLRNESNFKWSVSNIGLQIFAKLGGKPWKVKPSNQNCLIIGVGQAHQFRKTEEGRFFINKYFAYSVLMDSSGIYKDIAILGDSTNEKQYMEQIKSKIEEIVKRYQYEFKKFVIHTPFKIKNKELNAIRDSIQALSNSLKLTDIEFVVMKVNTSNNFFGYYSQSNSLVPFESTCLQLSHKEYLIWFEGIQLNKPNVSKRFSGPTHIEFYYANQKLSDSAKMRYLQDVINLSGANWRGFNAKSLPVSIYYCQLIARRIKEFDAYGYENVQIETSTPWFL
jgi:hypothetical protein